VSMSDPREIILGRKNAENATRPRGSGLGLGGQVLIHA